MSLFVAKRDETAQLLLRVCSVEDLTPGWVEYCHQENVQDPLTSSTDILF